MAYPNDSLKVQKEMKKFIKRFLPLTIILAGMAVVYFTGVYKYLSFETLKENHKILKSFVTQHPVSVPVFFILSYITLTALSVPGVIFLSLLGGYLFPQPLSTIYVVLSATCGATLLFLAARSALGETLRKKAGPFLTKMKNGFQKNAASYLLFLRFVPLFPFWIVNLAPAFFGVSLRTFIWTTFIGIIPGSFVFTLAGAGLEKAFETQEQFSLNTVFNMELKIAFSLLGVLSLLPLLSKKLLKKMKK